MKKIFTFLIAIASVGFASAQKYQPAYSHQDGREQQYKSADRYEKNNYDRDYRNGNDRNNNYRKDYNDDRKRKQQIDRINRDYDQRIAVYRNDRRMAQRERERRIYQLNYERNQQLKSFGAGAAVGAVAGLLLGAILSH
jgi:hypothetical protein